MNPKNKDAAGATPAGTGKVPQEGSSRPVAEQAGAALRQKAEAALRGKAPELASQLEAHSLEEMRQTLQELQIYQIELEMQNEELRRSQVELDAERTRYFDFYNLAPVGYITVSEAGLIVEANLTLATLLGIERGALLKQRITRFILNEDVSAYYLLHKKLVENAGPQRCELRMLKSDGTQFWAHLAATAEQADHGVVLRVVLSDVTERKQAEAHLRLGNAALVAADNAILITARDGRIEWVNPAFRTLTGYSADESIGQNPRDLVKSGREKPAVYADLWATILSGRTWRGELINRRKDGSFYPEEQTITPVRDATGGITHFIAIKQDLTARKHAEAEIHRLAVFPMLNPNPVLEFSTDGLLIYSNHAAQAMAEAVGSSDVLNLLPADTQQIVTKCLASNQPHLRRETKHGPHTLSWSFYPIASLSVVHCYAGDITDWLRQEEALRQSQKMETIGQLAAGVAHDFNNLLTIVQLETAILIEDHSLDARCRSSVDEIAKAAERAANLTRQLLAFSRKQEKETRLIDLPMLVAEMTRLLRRILGENIVLSTHASQGLPPLLADPGMVEQLVMNLAVNSRDAMPNGGQIDFTVSEVKLDSAEIPQHTGGRPGSFLKLEVRDTGTGIAPEHLSRIFEPFFTTKEAGKGTGLGLATVFSIARQHGGWIEVASELGRGTVFHVFLPASAIPTGAEKSPAALLPATLKGGSETILVTEDEESIRRLMQVILERYGYRVLVAESGTKAVEMLSESRAKVDLLITDMVMPGGISGRELAQKLQVSRPELKVIFASGFTSEAFSQELNLEPGANFLRKPFSIYALVELVRHRLDSVGVT